ncbi:MAG: hypothetical protein ACOCSD_08455, partial [Halolamina sp.]
DTVYSEKGREMQVYGPADAPLIVYAGTEDETTGLKAALSRLLGAVAALGITSLLVQATLGDLPLPFGQTGGAEEYSAGGDDEATQDTTATEAATETEADGMGVAEATETPTPTAEPTGTPVQETAQAAAETAMSLPPGMLFFLGGATVLLGVTAVWWLKNR